MPASLRVISKIAPTVAIKFGELPLREQLREFGKMTGKEAEAETWIAAWDQKIAEVKPQVQAAVGDKTVSILQPYAKGIYAFGHNFGRGGDILYGELELKAPPTIQKEAIDSGQGWANLSLEKLPEYAGDYIFTNAWSGDDADPSVVYESSLWKNLPAVKNNLVFMTNRKGDLFNDPISLEAQLEFMLDFVKNTVSADFTKPGFSTMTRLKLEKVPALTHDEVSTIEGLVSKLSRKVDLMFVGKNLGASEFRGIVSDTLFEVIG